MRRTEDYLKEAIEALLQCRNKGMVHVWYQMHIYLPNEVPVSEHRYIPSEWTHQQIMERMHETNRYQDYLRSLIVTVPEQVPKVNSGARRWVMAHFGIHVIDACVRMERWHNVLFERWCELRQKIENEIGKDPPDDLMIYMDGVTFKWTNSESLEEHLVALRKDIAAGHLKYFPDPTADLAKIETRIALLKEKGL